MTVRFEVDISDPMRALQRLDSGPDTQTTLRFEKVLTEQFQATQAIVHVQTGSLKASGKIHSEIHDSVWSGSIEYGGASPGSEHDPVTYAEYERQRTGGRQITDGKYSGQVTSHDFMLPVAEAQTAYAQAILDYFRGEG